MRPFHAHHQHLQPVVARDTDRPPPRGIEITRFDPLQTFGLAGTHRTQPLQLQAFRFLDHALIPHHQHRLACRVQAFHLFIRLRPQIRLDHLRRPLRRMQQAADALRPCRSLVRPLQIASQLTQHQTLVAMPVHDHHQHQPQKGLHQPTVQAAVQCRQQPV